MSSPSAQNIAHQAYDTSAYTAAGSAMMSFQPINQIHQHLCGLHIYANDPTRSVIAHHFCTHLSADLHQCVIYDSDQPGARLIGIEYVITEDKFVGLPAEEKKYWHSHKYEVESGMLVLGTKSLVPNQILHVAERPAMLELHRTYGKTIHTWQPEVHPTIPLGPPQLMMAYTEDSQIDRPMLAKRDGELGVSTEDNKKDRAGYLVEEDMVRPTATGADSWLRGDRIEFKVAGELSA